MTCHLDECELTYRAYCSRCQWNGADCATVREAVLRCQKHNRMRRHIPGHKGYAHVRVVHHHETTAGAAHS